MNNFTKAFIIAIIASLSFSSCEIFGDKCKKCEEAIDHMCNKLKSNNCDPDRMADAFTRMQEDCDVFSAGVYAGYMAEHCNTFGDPICPFCTDKDQSVPAAGALSIADIRMSFSTVNWPSYSNELTLFITNGGNQETLEMRFGLLTVILWEHEIFEGSTFNFQLVDEVSNAVLLDESTTFAFHRANAYLKQRSSFVRYDNLEYTMGYNNW